MVKALCCGLMCDFIDPCPPFVRRTKEQNKNIRFALLFIACPQLRADICLLWLEVSHHHLDLWPPLKICMGQLDSVVLSRLPWWPSTTKGRLSAKVWLPYWAGLRNFAFSVTLCSIIFLDLENLARKFWWLIWAKV